MVVVAAAAAAAAAASLRVEIEIFPQTSLPNSFGRCRAVCFHGHHKIPYLATTTSSSGATGFFKKRAKKHSLDSSDGSR
jgi:hypothetical protein